MGERMSKIDAVSEAIGDLRSDSKYILRELTEIKEHLKTQNGRIGKSETCVSKIEKDIAIFRAKVIAWGAGAGAVTGFFIALLNILLK